MNDVEDFDALPFCGGTSEARRTKRLTCLPQVATNLLMPTTHAEAQRRTRDRTTATAARAKGPHHTSLGRRPRRSARAEGASALPKAGVKRSGTTEFAFLHVATPPPGIHISPLNLTSETLARRVIDQPTIPETTTTRRGTASAVP